MSGQCDVDTNTATATVTTTATTEEQQESILKTPLPQTPQPSSPAPAPPTPKPAEDTDTKANALSMTDVLADLDIHSMWTDSKDPNKEKKIDQKQAELQSFLYEGCQTGNIEQVRSALERNSNPAAEVISSLGRITPIFLCAAKGYVEIAQLLIKNNQDVVFKRMEFDGSTCLHVAATYDHPEMIEMLIHAGLYVNVQDKLGRTPLMDAAEIGSCRVIDILARYNADVNLTDNERHSAISYSLDFVCEEEPKFLSAAQKLIQHGADPNLSGRYSNRVSLHYAAAQGNISLVKHLIEDKAVYAEPLDDNGKTPLIYAQENGHQQVGEYLKNLVEVRNRNKCGCNIM